MSGGIEIPLFPLNAVLFPGGSLPLRIFEARYIDLVRNCMRSGDGFGIVLIVEGPEAGGPAQTCDVGTYARIIDFSQQPDGLLGIHAVGERRFRIACRRDGKTRITVDHSITDFNQVAADHEQSRRAPGDLDLRLHHRMIAVRHIDRDQFRWRN